MNASRQSDREFIATMSNAIGLALGLALVGCTAEPPAAEPATPVAQSEPAAAAEAPVLPATDDPFAMMDADGDGTISPDEHAERAAGMFATMDGDKDGFVTAAEMDDAQAILHGDTRMSSADKIKAIDGDGDGVLSVDEHAAGSKTMFGTMDADHDGRLTAAEIQAGHDAMMGGKTG